MIQNRAAKNAWIDWAIIAVLALWRLAWSCVPVAVLDVVPPGVGAYKLPPFLPPTIEFHPTTSR